MGDPPRTRPAVPTSLRIDASRSENLTTDDSPKTIHVTLTGGELAAVSLAAVKHGIPSTTAATNALALANAVDY